MDLFRTVVNVHTSPETGTDPLETVCLSEERKQDIDRTRVAVLIIFRGEVHTGEGTLRLDSLSMAFKAMDGVRQVWQGRGWMGP